MLSRDVFSTCLFRHQRPFHSSSYFGDKATWSCVPSPDVCVREIQWRTQVIHQKLSLPRGQHGTKILYRGTVEWALNYTDPTNPIGVPKSRHEERLTGKGTIGKKARTLDLNLFHSAHFHVL
jgi:hypothetical protein